MCKNCHEIHLTTQHEMVDIASSGATGEIRREKLEELKNFVKISKANILRSQFTMRYSIIIFGSLIS
jgi:hypothetical protein